MYARVIKNDISDLHELSNVTTSYEPNFAFFRYLGPIIIAGDTEEKARVYVFYFYGSNQEALICVERLRSLNVILVY